MSQELDKLVSVPPEPYKDQTFNSDLNCPCDDNAESSEELSDNIDDYIDDLETNFIPLHPQTTTTFHELYYLSKHSVPVFFTFFIQYIVQILIPTYFSSHLGPIYMSACSLSFTTFYLTGPVLVNGFSSCLDTLCSTAYGAKHYHKVGHYYAQCTLLLSLLIIPSIYFWSNAYPFFDYITKFNNSADEDISNLKNLCTSYISMFTYVAPAIVVFECTKRFLQSQCRFSIPTRIVVGGIPTSIFFNWYLKNVTATENAYLVPIISFVTTYWLMTFALVGYTFMVDGYQCLPSLQDLKSWTLISFFKSCPIYFNLGIPGILMILSEALAFQIITFSSASFPKDQLAAQSIVNTLSSLAFQPPYAIGICCSTHIANLIGSRSSNYKSAINAIYILMLLLSIFNFTWFYSLRVKIITIFTNDEKIIKTASNLAIILAINQIFDCINIITAAILRGQGRQKIGSILSILNYYIIGVPLELYLGFYLNFQVYGLWTGLAIGVLVLSMVQLFIVKNSDWMKIMKNNHKLV